MHRIQVEKGPFPPGPGIPIDPNTGKAILTLDQRARLRNRNTLQYLNPELFGEDINKPTWRDPGVQRRQPQFPMGGTMPVPISQPGRPFGTIPANPGTGAAPYQPDVLSLGRARQIQAGTFPPPQQTGQIAFPPGMHAGDVASINRQRRPEGATVFDPETGTYRQPAGGMMLVPPMTDEQREAARHRQMQGMEQFMPQGEGPHTPATVTPGAEAEFGRAVGQVPGLVAGGISGLANRARSMGFDMLGRFAMPCGSRPRPPAVAGTGLEFDALLHESGQRS